MITKKKVRIFVRTFFFVVWKTNIYSKSFSIGLFFWLFLYLGSLFYRIIFYIYKITRTKELFLLPIINIGNISVGGTGKSVVTSFLVQNVRFPCLAIFLRGHQREKSNNPILIASIGQGLQKEVSLVGDEAAMHAQYLSTPVVVGAKRSMAINYFLCHVNPAPLSYALLDDGFQHFSVEKTCSIVLLDARNPLGNGWLFPAGDLRENNLQRADIIIFSHAQNCLQSERKKLIALAYKKKGKVLPIIFGYHAVSQISQYSHEKAYKKNVAIKDKQVFVFAGIGSFNQFVQMVKSKGADVVGSYEYPDHYLYSLEDIEDLMHAVKRKKVKAIVTTAKDWVKVYALISDKKNISLDWLILHVEFVCTSEAEKRILLRTVDKAIIKKYLSV
ncbi:tetraacyldisaccharide 4'-kinase [Candidatus Babeliales bacterium]|nr:tetraacyldisaccharide 4'-kinase [Candidatus Babeliales bacterium]